MKKTLYAFLLLFLCCQPLYSKPVRVETARTVAAHFFSHVTGKTVEAVTLAYTETNAGVPVYFAFNVNPEQGFILVAADDRSTPVLGYGVTSHFIYPTNNIVGVRDWLIKYADEITYIVKHDLKADKAINTAWQESLNGNFSTGGKDQLTPANAAAVTPLCTARWDQAPFYNETCPYDSTAKELTVTGCPATAMAQIMKKWAYPQIGSGNHTYSSATYGSLAADFGASTYNWAAMPDSIGASNAEIAKLMFHCGVATEMAYNVAAKGGSGAYVLSEGSPKVHCCQYAYVTYFRYDSTTIKGVTRKSYNDADWTALMKTDLDLGRPIQYSGVGKEGGHTWVCDGYDAGSLLHMNWGWGGSNDGYYAITALNPGTLGIGGGSGGFNDDQDALIGIKPIAPPLSGKIATMKLGAPIVVNPSPIPWMSEFTVKTKVSNSGTDDFTGLITASVYDLAGRLVANVQTLQNQTVAAGQTSPELTFTTTGITTVPGQYTVGIYLRRNADDITIVPSSGAFVDPVPVTLTGPVNDVKLSSPIEVPLALKVTKPGTFKVNILNSGASTFTGSFRIDLYDAAGNDVTTVTKPTIDTSLAAGATFSAPLSFKFDSLPATPGTYFAYVSCMPSGGTWQPCGSALFQNPIFIVIDDSTLLPDTFEPNETQATAFALPLNFFNGNNTNVSTTGANIHVGIDQDYYKIELPDDSYTYEVKPVIRDIINEPALFTNHVLYSYSTNGNDWSRTYEDTLKTPIAVARGSKLFFHVATVNIGDIGTYVLSVNVTRTPTNGVQALVSDRSFTITPNPASSQFMLANSNANVSMVEIRNLLGQSVKRISHDELQRTGGRVQIGELGNGVYFVTMRSTDKVETVKLVVNR